MNHYAIIIPALNPTEKLIDYVNTLLAKGAKQIIVVNDGSKEELTHIFTKLSKIKGCTVLIHEKNKGKGRALKTAFSYVMKYHMDLDGVITADADGQHSIEDVEKVAAMLTNHRRGIILGIRDFCEEGVPARSYLGNRVTSKIFQLLYGTILKDTQTGLRGIPKDELPWMVELKGERYEYEINMLVFAQKMNIKIYEIPIQTLYFNHNSGSHYNPFIDSTRVFMKLISGCFYNSFSIIISGIIDLGSFILLNNVFLEAFPLKTRVFYATFVARLLSSYSHFFMNRHILFKGKNDFSLSRSKYAFLYFGNICASYFLVVSANFYMDINVIFAKILIDVLLGILSYEIQLHWLSKKNNGEKRENVLLEKKDEG